MNRLVEWQKDVAVALIMIEIYDDIRNRGDQTMQNLALHWSEVEETIQH